MDMTAVITKGKAFVIKYKYVLLVLAVGIGLMLIPGRSKKTESTEQATVSEEVIDDRAALEHILSRIEGAGKVELLLTYAAGKTTIYQVDEDRTDSGIRTETVVLSDGDRAQTGLISQIRGPEYLGAVVVCQGAEDPAVKLAIMEAVADATGLGTDRISVIKMK